MNMSSKRYRNGCALEYLYHELGMSSAEIADEFDCCDGTVLHWMEKHNIDKRRPLATPIPECLSNSEWLRAEYHNKGKSQRQIAKENNCTRNDVRKALNKHNIETRPNPSEQSPEDFQNREKLYELYVDGERSYNQLAEMYDVAVATVQYWVNKHGFEYRSEHPSGEDHARYSGGRTYNRDKYGVSWNEELRESIRERDNRTCQRCGVKGHNLRNKLSVHHITPVSELPEQEANDPDNLVALCPSCHHRIEWLPSTPQFKTESNRIE